MKSVDLTLSNHSVVKEKCKNIAVTLCTVRYNRLSRSRSDVVLYPTELLLPFNARGACSERADCSEQADCSQTLIFVNVTVHRHARDSTLPASPLELLVHMKETFASK